MKEGGPGAAAQGPPASTKEAPRPDLAALLRVPALLTARGTAPAQRPGFDETDHGFARPRSPRVGVG